MLLAYFDTTVRYLRLASLQSLDRIASMLTGCHGLRHADLQVRCRAAYSLLRITEGLEPKAFLLLSHVNKFADIILHTGSFLGFGNNVKPQLQQSLLTESAELHLLEATSLITRPKPLAALTSVVPHREWDKASYVSGTQEEQEEQQRQLQQRQLAVLHELSSVLVKQVQTFLSHKDMNRFASEIAEATAHKISCLASLAKGLTSRSLAEHSSMFEHAAMVVVAACNSLGGHAVVRAKTVIFLHRMVAMLGSDVLKLLGHMYPALLQHSDSTDTDHVVQVLNQVMVEFQSQSRPLIDAVFGITCDKFEDLLQRFETAQMENRWFAEQASRSALAGLGIAADGNREPIAEAPHIDLERATLQRQYVVFLQHVVTQNSEVVLLSPANQHRLEGVLAHLLGAIRGQGIKVNLPTSPSNGSLSPNARNKTSEMPRISIQASLPMRKCAIAALIGLCKAWEPAALQDTQRAPTLPLQLVHAFRNFMFDKALPLCLGGMVTGYSLDSWSQGNSDSSTGSSLSSFGNSLQRCEVPGLRLNLADAQTQNIVLEVGSLLHTATQAYGKEHMVGYLQQALPLFGWGANSTQALLNLIMDSGLNGISTAAQLMPFKEHFKKIFRSCTN